VIRTPVGGGIRGGHYHSQSPEALFIHTPGLKVVAPSNPYDAKGLLLSCMRQNDPVLFMEPKRIYRASKGDVPEGEYTIELGKAAIVREGSQVTLLAWSGMVPIAEEAAKQAEQAGISVEVIDLRTLLPFDIDALIASTRKTGRVVIVHEAPRTCGFGAELIASIQERAMEYLEAPIIRVTGFDTPFPYSLEHEYMPNADRVMGAIRQTLEW
jgi:2-oxoisovalerate dehydrogenase E1 component beta subunit